MCFEFNILIINFVGKTSHYWSINQLFKFLLTKVRIHLKSGISILNNTFNFTFWQILYITVFVVMCTTTKKILHSVCLNWKLKVTFSFFNFLFGQIAHRTFFVVRIKYSKKEVCTKFDQTTQTQTVYTFSNTPSLSDYHLNLRLCSVFVFR